MPLLQSLNPGSVKTRTFSPAPCPPSTCCEGHCLSELSLAFMSASSKKQSCFKLLVCHATQACTHRAQVKFANLFQEATFCSKNGTNFDSQYFSTSSLPLSENWVEFIKHKKWSDESQLDGIAAALRYISQNENFIASRRYLIECN